MHKNEPKNPAPVVRFIRWLAYSAKALIHPRLSYAFLSKAIVCQIRLNSLNSSIFWRPFIELILDLHLESQRLLDMSLESHRLLDLPLEGLHQSLTLRYRGELHIGKRQIPSCLRLAAREHG